MNFEVRLALSDSPSGMYVRKGEQSLMNTEIWER